MGRVIRSRQAKRDAVQIWVHIAEQNMWAADALLADFDEALNHLGRFPDSAPSREELGAGLRSYPVGRYLLFYREATRGIELVRISTVRGTFERFSDAGGRSGSPVRRN
jgi:toxin ParE1/3/4